MIRIKCPKCANPLGVPDTQAGSAASCPKCGQKFRVPTSAAKAASASRPEAAPPTKASGPDEEPAPRKDDRKRAATDAPGSRTAAKTAPAARQRAAAEQGSQGYDVGPAPESSPPSRSSESRAADEDAPERDDEEEEREERVPRRKKKKKKKKKQEAVGPSGAHVALIAVGVLVVLAATGIFFWIQRGGSAKAEVDPAPVLAELERVHAVIERDETKPDKPVVGVTLTGCEFKGELLKNLAVFPQLRRLNLGSTLTSDIKLQWLEDVTTLRSLSLSHTKVTGGGMQFLKKMVNLEELNLNQTLVDDFRLNDLKGLTKLKKIYLDGTLANGLGLKEAIPDLEVIR